MKNEYLGHHKSVLDQKRENFYKKYVLIVILLFFAGLVVDAVCNGFYIIRNAKSLGWSIVGILILSIFYLFGEAGAEWISSNDNVSNPLYKRAFNMLLLLCFVGVLAAVLIFVFKYLEWKI